MTDIVTFWFGNDNQGSHNIFTELQRVRKSSWHASPYWAIDNPLLNMINRNIVIHKLLESPRFSAKQCCLKLVTVLSTPGNIEMGEREGDRWKL